MYSIFYFRLHNVFNKIMGSSQPNVIANCFKKAGFKIKNSNIEIRNTAEEETALSIDEWDEFTKNATFRKLFPDNLRSSFRDSNVIRSEQLTEDDIFQSILKKKEDIQESEDNEPNSFNQLCLNTQKQKIYKILRAFFEEKNNLPQNILKCLAVIVDDIFKRDKRNQKLITDFFE